MWNNKTDECFAGRSQIKNPITGVQKFRQVHYVSQFVHIDKKLSNQSIFREVNLASVYIQGSRAFHVRTNPRHFYVLINKFINCIPVNM